MDKICEKRTIVVFIVSKNAGLLLGFILTYVYQGVRNVSFLENFAYILSERFLSNQVPASECYKNVCFSEQFGKADFANYIVLSVFKHVNLILSTYKHFLRT